MPASDIYNFPLFKNVEQPLLDSLVNSHSVISFPAEMQLIRKGVFNNKVYVLLEGKVSIRDKNNKSIKVLKSKNIFGEISVLDANPASATVITLTNCKVIILTEQELWLLSEHSHAFTSNLLQLVVERLRSFSSQLDLSKDSAKSMQKKAYLDASTGIFNRTWLKEKSTQIIQHHKQQSNALCLIMTDIDYFKVVNDTYGHDAGDLVLRQVALMLQSISQKRVYVIRLGGDEMCVILPIVQLHEAIIMTERIRIAVEDTVFKFADNQSLKITSSFGVSTLREGMTIKELMKQADIALYEAKKSGRNKVVSFDDVSSQSLTVAD